MKVLIGCETSGTIREAFKRLGHEVTSCDLLPSQDNSSDHHVGDIVEFLERGTRYDLIILHPTCTALCVAGNSTYGEGKKRYSERLAAVNWTMDLWTLAKSLSDRVCLENPIGVLQRLGKIKKPNYVHPWQHGHAEQKKTGLYLHGLPPLTPSEDVYAHMLTLPKCERQRMHYMSPSADRWQQRSKTYQGIANAMANQWGQNE